MYTYNICILRCCLVLKKKFLDIEYPFHQFCYLVALQKQSGVESNPVGLLRKQFVLICSCLGTRDDVTRGDRKWCYVVHYLVLVLSPISNN